MRRDPHLRAHGPVRAGTAPAAATPRRRFVRIWLASSAVLFALGALWALATPVGASPDEPTQVVKAAAVVRGQFIGTPVRHGPAADVRVRVPASFGRDQHLATCYAGLPRVPAGCAHPLSTRSRPVTVATYVGRYPPLYYLLVGAPTLLWRGDGAVVAIRLLSALWGALLLGTAVGVATVWSRSRLLVPALAVAVTPMAVFLIGVVNPSGLEIAAAVATWTGAVVLVLDRRDRPPPALVLATVVPATVLVLCRGASALWLAIALGTAALLAPGALRALWRDRRVRRALQVLGMTTVLAVAFVLGFHSLAVVPVGRPVPPHASTVSVVVQALGLTGAIAREAVGDFGWLDTMSPFAVLVGWWAAAALLVVGGLLWSDRRHARVLAGTVALALLLPVAIIVSQAHHDGLVWQARDGMPLYVGVPIVAGAIFGRDRERRFGALLDGPSLAVVRQVAARGNLLLVVGVAAAQWVDFFWALRRYTVGLGGPLAPWTAVRHGWAPPIPAVLLLGLAAAAAGAYGWWTLQLANVATGRTLAGVRVGAVDGAAAPARATARLVATAPAPAPAAPMPAPAFAPAAPVPSPAPAPAPAPVTLLPPAAERLADALLARLFPAVAAPGGQVARRERGQAGAGPARSDGVGRERSTPTRSDAAGLEAAVPAAADALGIDEALRSLLD